MLFMTVAGSIFKIVHELQRGKKIDTPIMFICHQENWNSEPALFFFLAQGLLTAAKVRC